MKDFFPFFYLFIYLLFLAFLHTSEIIKKVRIPTFWPKCVSIVCMTEMKYIKNIKNLPRDHVPLLWCLQHETSQVSLRWLKWRHLPWYLVKAEFIFVVAKWKECFFSFWMPCNVVTETLPHSPSGEYIVFLLCAWTYCLNDTTKDT